MGVISVWSLELKEETQDPTLIPVLLEAFRRQCYENTIFIKVWWREAGYQVLCGKPSPSSREEQGDGLLWRGHKSTARPHW